MIRWVVFAIAAIAVGLWVSDWLINDPGLVYIERGNTGISLSLATALLMIAVLGIVVYVVIQLLKLLLYPGRWARKSLLQGSKDRARKRTDKGFIAYSSGNFKQARQQLLASVGNVESPVINYLLAARCSQFIGDDDRALELLDQAQLADPEAHSAVSVVQAEIYQQRGDWEQSLATLKPLEQKNNAMAIRSLATTYETLGDFESLYELTRLLEKQQVLSKPELAILRETTVIRWIEQCVDHIRRGRKSDESLSDMFDSIAKRDREKESIALAYARALIALSKTEQAEQFLRPLMKRDVSAKLLTVYGETDGSDVFKQLKLLQSVRCEDRFAVMLAMARQSRRAELWGQARDFYSRCFEMNATIGVAKPYAAVLRSMGEVEAAIEVEHRAVAGA